RVASTLISSSMRRLASAATAMTSSRVGTVSDVTAPARLLRRNALSSATVRSLTGPLPVVVRSSVGSWMTTTSPSFERWTSNSMKSAPRASAFRKASRLFSGHSAAPPRWAASSVAGLSCAPAEPAITATAPTAQPSTSRARKLFLALDEALHEPALHEEDDGHRRQERHDGPGHDQVPGRQLGAAPRDQLLEADDDGAHGFGVGDQDRPEVLVPPEDEEDHEQRGDIRPRQREQELEQEAHGAGAVELRGFAELVGDRQVELAEEEGRGRRGHQGDGQPLVAVEPAQGADDLVRGHEANGHGKHEREEDHPEAQHAAAEVEV